jgi:hypothetical protein
MITITTKEDLQLVRNILSARAFSLVYQLEKGKYDTVALKLKWEKELSDLNRILDDKVDDRPTHMNEAQRALYDSVKPYRP